jgi:hypothetical protein
MTEIEQQVEQQVEPMNDVIEQLNIAKINGEISTKYHKRLYTILEKLIEYEKDGLITMKTKETIETNSWLSINAVNCILNFETLTLNDPKEFHDRIYKMIDDDNNGIWIIKKNYEMPKNPTWAVYEMFRKIGLKPRSRGSQETDPGKSVMIYFKEWKFINNENFRKIAQKMSH